MGPLHWALAGIWLELDAVRAFGRKRRGREGLGEAPLSRDWKRKREPALGNVLHVETFMSMPSIWPSIPFCFSLKFCQDNTAVTTPNTVTVATHSATKEAVVVMRTPEEGGTVISRNYIAWHTLFNMYRRKHHNLENKSFWTENLHNREIYTYILPNSEVLLYRGCSCIYIHTYLHTVVLCIIIICSSRSHCLLYNYVSCKYRSVCPMYMHSK